MVLFALRDPPWHRLKGVRLCRTLNTPQIRLANFYFDRPAKASSAGARAAVSSPHPRSTIRTSWYPRELVSNQQARKTCLHRTAYLDEHCPRSAFVIEGACVGRVHLATSSR